VRDEISEFEAKGVKPFGVNPASVDAHAKYVKKFEFNFALLSDGDRAIASAYHALKDDGRGIQRTVYLIGSDGRVLFGVRGAPPTAEILAPLGG
jgi:peroxiredoxin Q/BCP